MILPLFPLQSVFFPGETVPLHIFEERYKSLISDCRQHARTFGIPVYLNETISHGTEVQLKEIVNTYADRSMDVVCVARQVFRVLSFQPRMEGKLYPGGEVQFLDTLNDADASLTEAVIQACGVLYGLMDLPFGPVRREVFNSFSLAHKMGLSLQQEFELLCMPGERERLEFLLAHLKQTATVMEQLNRTRERIGMNGHFRNFDPLDFEGLTL
ncbi:LON peptidase substrate-binding domain-containing protein [Robiginitalea sediminis]|uniref:LON peptidase substrate-binding domain-containing protein n=1 Tax=Robiginitalea sediminis TaxID=1982593 RepID=UPI000B4BCB17|nr:LON peptidase substrate-binding domain-containing protein [Robiginitalea sediminis]